MFKKLIILGSILAVGIPVFYYIKNVPWGDSSLTASLFPLFGFIAFTLLWLHAISGVFEEWLRKQFNFDSFVYWTSWVIFISIILHPLLLLILVKFNVGAILAASSNPWILTGITGLTLLLTYDVGKALKKYEFFVRNWNKILIISNIGFIFIFFHSLNIGQDLQSGFMRGLWIFYGVTAILAIIYTYGFKKRT